MSVSQAMSASKFVIPFLDDVKSWEKKLSTIGECCDIWLVVQRKWQYLEGIFIGSDDIRLQVGHLLFRLHNFSHVTDSRNTKSMFI